MPINPLMLAQGGAGLQYGLRPPQQMVQALAQPPSEKRGPQYDQGAYNSGIMEALANPIRIESGSWGEALAEALAAGLRGQAVRNERQDDLNRETIEQKREEAPRRAISDALAGFDPANPQGMVERLRVDAPEQAYDLATALIGQGADPIQTYGALEQIDGRLGQRNQVTGQYDWAPQVPQSEMSRPPSGYRPTQDGNLEAIPGGPADIRQTAEGRSRLAQMESSERSLQTALSALDQANAVLDRNNDWWNPLDDSTGIQGQTLRGIGGTNARDLDQALEPVRAILSFETLAEMRRNSATGGALGSIAVRELELLGNTMASLDTAQSEDQVRQAMTNVRTRLQSTLAAIQAARDEMGGGQEQAPTNDGSAPTQPRRLRWNPATGQLE